MIIALRLGVPFVALGYSTKISSALKDYGLEDSLIKGKLVSSEYVLSLFTQVTKKSEPSSNIQKARTQSYEKLTSYFENIKHLYNDKN